MLRLAFTLLLLSMAAGLPAAAQPRLFRAGEVAIVVEFAEDFSPQALQEMEIEAQRLVKGAGVRLAFRRRDEAARESYSELVFFKMSGHCQMDSFPPLLDERGPLAWSLTADGRVIPFGEVQCDRLREAIKTAMSGRDYRVGNQLLGRAMGRVVAHELYHMMSQRKGHGKQGVGQERLTPRQLIAERMEFGDHERELIEAGARKNF